MIIFETVNLYNVIIKRTYMKNDTKTKYLYQNINKVIRNSGRMGKYKLREQFIAFQKAESYLIL